MNSNVRKYFRIRIIQFFYVQFYLYIYFKFILGAAKWLTKHCDNECAAGWLTSDDDESTGRNKRVTKTNALMLALMNAHIKLATECFMTDVDDHRDPVTMLDVKWDVVLSESQFEVLMPKLLIRHVMEHLTEYAPSNEFHFSLFIKMFRVFCEDSTKSLETFFNYAINSFFESLRNRTLRDGMTDVDLVYKLVQFCALLNIAKENHKLMRQAIEVGFKPTLTLILNP